METDNVSYSSFSVADDNLFFVGRYLLTASEFLFNAIDALAYVSLSPNQYISEKAREMVKACFLELNNIKTMDECHVPIHASPMINKVFDSNSINDLDIEYYNQYPQPWYALMYDLTHSVVHI